jgi:hypothetical protein
MERVPVRMMTPVIARNSIPLKMKWVTAW